MKVSMEAARILVRRGLGIGYVFGLLRAVVQLATGRVTSKIEPPFFLSIRR